LELLFFGFVRPYKGLDVLLEALRRLNDAQVFLTVIGEMWSQKQLHLAEAIRAPNVDLHPRFMGASEVAAYFERADYLVLPYRAASGSAVASVAFRYDTPLIGSRIGGLKDVIVEGLTGWPIPPGDVKALANAIGRTTRAEAERLASGVIAFKTSHNWQSLCNSLVSLVP
jgi:glycosyltransferase involved in cell wall biosynthesis